MGAAVASTGFEKTGIILAEVHKVTGYRP
jgi:hypothetical protein